MKAMAPDRNQRYSTADEMLADLDAFRRDPNINFDYSAEDLRRELGKSDGDEPTQYLPNTGVTRTKQNHYTPPVEDDEDDDEYDEKPRSNWWLILILILIVVGAGYYGATKLYTNIMQSFQQEEIPEYTVPSVVGLTIEEAEKLETVKGIFELVEEGSEYSLEYAEGQIIRQSPEADRIRKNASGDLSSVYSFLIFLKSDWAFSTAFAFGKSNLAQNIRNARVSTSLRTNSRRLPIFAGRFL